MILTNFGHITPCKWETPVTEKMPSKQMIAKMMMDKDMRRQLEEVDKLWFGIRRPEFFLWFRHFCVTLDWSGVPLPSPPIYSSSSLTSLE